MEGVTVEMRDEVSGAQRKGYTAYHIVQLGILGTFMCLFFAWFALSPAVFLGNGYDVLKYYLGYRDIIFVDKDLNLIILAMFIMNILLQYRIVPMALLPLFAPRCDRRLGKMFYSVPVAVYLGFIILSVGLMVKISTNHLTVWLFPIFTLSFSIICLLGSVISMIVIYIKKYGKINIFRRNKAEGSSINNIEKGLLDDGKRLTMEALIWIFDAAFLILSVAAVFL